MLQIKECAPIFILFFHRFTLGHTFESLKEFGGMSLTLKKILNLFGYNLIFYILKNAYIHQNVSQGQQNLG
jgi:hypothetical protein